MIPITSNALKTNIKKIPELLQNVPVQNEIDPVTNKHNDMLDHYCTAFVTTVTDSVVSNTKERLDVLEANYNSLITSLTTLAASLTAIPLTSVAGVALATDMIAQTAGVLSRATARSVQDGIQKPYIDGVKQ